jgi:hypothetical protein
LLERPKVVLIQLTLTLMTYGSADVSVMLATTQRELVEAFGDATAHFLTRAHGVWTLPHSQRDEDPVLTIEVVGRTFDRAWWREYLERLGTRFVRDGIHLRATEVELLDLEAC